MPYLILGIALAVGLVLIARGIGRSDPRLLLQVFKWGGGIVVALFVLYLAFIGRLGTALLIAAAIIPMALRWRAMQNIAKSRVGPSAGKSSEVETAYLRMSLDHDSGELDGLVTEGPFRGSRLSEMTLEQHVELLRECRLNDPDSVSVLEAFMDRVHGTAWRLGDAAGAAGAEETGGGNGGSRWGRGAADAPGAMSRDEAYQVLGIKPGASTAEIKDAHHKMMQRHHPDHGGSTEQAARINQAKDVLLGD